MASSSREIAIIGCGISGLCLALSLQKRGISCVLYEQRSGPISIGGSITIFPNGLSVLDSLGVYDDAHSYGNDMEESIMRNAAFEIVSRSSLSNKELFGYKVLRIRRDSLLQVLVEKLRQFNVPMYFEYKFSRIISEDASEVSFEFTNGEKRTASLLIGADGIHSKVRQCSFSDTPAAVFEKEAGFAWTVPKSTLRMPAGEDVAATMIRTPQGVVLMVNDDSSGKNLRVGVTRPVPDKNREEWEAFFKNKDEQLKIINVVYPEAPDIIRSALKGAETSDIFIWPYYTMSPVPNWITPNGRIIIVGDAAHAFSPAGGQGGGMGIEDAYTLAFCLSASEDLSSLQFWHRKRKERVQQVVNYTYQVMQDRKNLQGTNKGMALKPDDDELLWLYNWRADDFIESWETQQK